MKKKQTFCSVIVLSAGVAMAASTGVIAPEMRILRDRLLRFLLLSRKR